MIWGGGCVCLLDKGIYAMVELASWVLQACVSDIFSLSFFSPTFLFYAMIY